jgi:hypothetical protein
MAFAVRLSPAQKRIDTRPNGCGTDYVSGEPDRFAALNGPGKGFLTEKSENV